jgi:hypothetical protein
VAFLGSSRQMLGSYVGKSHNLFLPNPLQFISHPTIRRCMVSTSILKASLNNLRKRNVLSLDLEDGHFIHLGYLWPFVKHTKIYFCGVSSLFPLLFFLSIFLISLLPVGTTYLFQALYRLLHSTVCIAKLRPFFSPTQNLRICYLEHTRLIYYFRFLQMCV